jgi:hypothetical protein
MLGEFFQAEEKTDVVGSKWCGCRQKVSLFVFSLVNRRQWPELKTGAV